MAATLKKGDKVRQIIVPIEGVVERFDVDQETGELQVLVSTDVNGDGVLEQRYMKADQLEVIV